MKVIRSNEELRRALAKPRREGQTIGLVPTMGALHEGHLSLLRAARKRCDVVVMSLFVNPAQFAPDEDLDRYPHDEERDRRLAEQESIDILYAPPAEAVYPAGFATSVSVEGLTEVLCGSPARRGPEHFRGVTTVVAKLFNMVDPDIAFFGQKDAQQAVVIRRMAEDLDFPVEIVVLPTVREPDGLAMSSRNRYLDTGERERALALNRVLNEAQVAVLDGFELEDALAGAEAKLRAAGVDPEYLEARHADDLSPARRVDGRPILVAVAAQVGGARLIDNVLIEPEGSS